jgi:hypothetical protein
MQACAGGACISLPSSRFLATTGGISHTCGSPPIKGGGKVGAACNQPRNWQRCFCNLHAAAECPQRADSVALYDACRDDVAVNPNDTEESIWAFLCEAQLEGAEAARTKMLKVGC